MGSDRLNKNGVAIRYGCYAFAVTFDMGLVIKMLMVMMIIAVIARCRDNLFQNGIVEEGKERRLTGTFDDFKVFTLYGNSYSHRLHLLHRSVFRIVLNSHRITSYNVCYTKLLRLLRSGL